MIELGKRLIQINGEVIQKRRQNMFYKLVEDYEGVVTGIVSLSLTLRGKIDITLKENLLEKYTPFSSFFGKLVYLYLNDEHTVLRKEVRAQPKEIQAIAQWVFGDKFKRSLGLEFIYSALPTIYSLEELSVDFIEVPDFVDLSTSSAKGVMLFESFEKISEPFYLVRLNKSVRGKGMVRYYFKHGSDVKTNVTSKLVKDYLEELFANEFKIGLILAVSSEKLGYHRWNMQPIILSEDITMLKKAYRGTSVHGMDFLQSLGMLNKRFTNSDPRIKIYHARPTECDSILKLGSINGGLVKGNLLFHEEGIVTLNPKRKTKYYKIYDYIFNDDYEPIGLRLINDSGDILNIPTKIDDDFISRGIVDSYAKVGVYTINDKEVKVDFYEMLSKRYSECAICGVVAGLKRSGLCWTCNTKLFRLAVANGDKPSFTTDKLLTRKSKVDFTTYAYKYEVVFTEKSMTFTECDWCWKGKEGYLPYDWWA